MRGIANLTVPEFQARVLRFDRRYVAHWNTWLERQPHETAELFGAILRRWQACRPNRMRRTREENLHPGPFLEDLMVQAEPHILTLHDFDIRNQAAFTPKMQEACVHLWAIFRNLSFGERSRGGLSGVVGISKAVLLLTNGRLGPAFDSRVRRRLGVGNISDATAWIRAIQAASHDIRAFETANQTTLHVAVPTQYSNLQTARLYDMALGPGGQ